MILPTDISGVSDGTARRIIAEGRSIAPCIDSLDGDPKLDAIAILTGVAAQLAARRPGHIKSERVGPAAAEYFDVGSAFTDGDRAALRALCSATATPAGMPVGSFPIIDPSCGPWPEGDYS